MNLKSLIKKIIINSPSNTVFSVLPDIEGLNLFIEDDSFQQCINGSADIFLLNQYACLQMLVEQGLAEPIPNGFVIPSEHAVCLDDDIRYLLKLPERFEGSISTKIKGLSSQAAFNVRLILQYLGEEISNYELSGPCLKISKKEVFLLNSQQWLAFSSVKKHQSLLATEKNEQQNLLLIKHLQQAKQHDLNIDLAQFNKLNIIHPDKVGVAADENADGDLILTPTFGSSINPIDTSKLLGQLKNSSNIASMHIKDDIVLLDEDRFKATQEILSNRRIPKNQIKRFLSAPSAFLDAALVNLDTGFSLRVKGATAFHHQYFGDTDSSDIDWFGELAKSTLEASLISTITCLDDVEEFEKIFIDAQQHGAESVVFNGDYIDISNPDSIREHLERLKKTFSDSDHNDDELIEEVKNTDALETAVIDIVSNDEELQFGCTTLVNNIDYTESINFNAYKRQPFPHQEEGVRWLLGLMQYALKKREPSQSELIVNGALLADDMGLGKTYIALVAMSEVYKLPELKNETKKPALIVAPLSLIENWIDESNKTYQNSPFKDIVVLQSNADLKKYKIKGASTETKQAVSQDSSLDSEGIRYSLKVGKNFGNERLDLPERLVITTYQTLRDYQFSLCTIDWQLVIFDEAQNIKNPNAMQTRAAKGLKANFKLLATGTPVENSLTDYWCLLDTAQPGLLGSYQEFRNLFIKPITQADLETTFAIRTEIGRALRKQVGKFMLRRLKEDRLKGLPTKTIFVGADNNSQNGWEFDKSLATVMRNSQLNEYDTVIEGLQLSKDRGESLVLKALHELRSISLHPQLIQVKEKSIDEINPKKFISLSEKLICILKIIDDIQKRKEKVIVFVINKKLQRLLKLCLSKMYSINIAVINGDTKAVSSKKGCATRKQMIEQFEAQQGFGIIIMSPIAAGVGLTVVGANNVIHLERHWNPAKEAQATDRVYRIGQKKDVNIYVPILLHPEHTSFDLNLNALLQNKIDLKDAVVTPQVVKKEDMQGVLNN